MVIARHFTPKRFALKLCAMMVSVFMLGGCQSSKTNNQTVINPSARALFGNNQPSIAQEAKLALLSAMEQHLASERFAVSTHYYQVSPIDHTNSVDKDASDLWTTIIKTNEYRRNQLNQDYQDPAFRRAIDYLYPSDDTLALGEDLGELPYLRYDDEFSPNNTQTNDIQTVNRSAGMGQTYQELYDDIDYFHDQTDDCINQTNDIISELDNSDQRGHKAIISRAKKSLASCQQQAHKHSTKLMPQAQGYQISDIKHITRCMSDYQQGLGELIHQNTLSTQNYKVLYSNYRTCSSLYYHNRRLEPHIYTNNSTAEKELQAFKESKICLNTQLDTITKLQNEQKTYRQHSAEYAQSYIDQSNCTARALDELLDANDFVAADNFDSAQSQHNDNEYWLFMGDFSDSDEQTNKYDGIKGWINAYKDLKAKPAKTENDESLPHIGNFGIYGSMISSVLDYIRQTPEQTQAQNLYQYNNTSLTGLAYHNPQAKQAKWLYSLDFNSPTASQSAQLPVHLDFQNSKLTADVSAILPLMAIVSPEHALLPQDIPNGQVSFGIPPQLAEQIPTAIIYESIVKGINQAYAGIHSEKFTPVDMTGDVFAKEVGATRVIKVELGSKEFGIMYATIAKQVVHDLKAYVDANPERYPTTPAKKDTDKENLDEANTDKTAKPKTDNSSAYQIKQLIDNFALANTAYRTSDMGGLLQLVEGFLPINFNGASYLYLDKTGKLLGIQTTTSLDSQMHNISTQSVNQIRYDKALFDSHRLSAQFYETFANNTSLDGNQWLGEHIDNHRLQLEASYARLNYNQSTRDNQSQQTDTTAP